MKSYFRVVTDGTLFRIMARTYGGDDKFVSNLASGIPIQFSTKEEAERYIHERLSMSCWQDA